MPMLSRIRWCLVAITLWPQTLVLAADPVQLELTGDWQIKVPANSPSAQKGISETIDVAPSEIFTVTAEKYVLPVYDPQKAPYGRGIPLRPLKSQETTTPYLLLPESLVLRAGPAESSQPFERGRDYEAELIWGKIGRLKNGQIAEGEPVYASYRHGLLRLDSIVRTASGKIEYRKGTPRAGAIRPVELKPAEERMANVWIPGPLEKLTEKNLFPVLETAYPEPPRPSPTIAEQSIPRSLKKLQTGEPLRILAWGDSVTEGSFLPDPQRNRWQEQFVARLKEHFPKANIELVTEAWGGRNTASYLAVPPGQPHNYAQTVLAAKPDLIVSEFVNDAGLKPDAVEQRYSKLLKDFEGIEAEWIILTPHYTRPDWMGLDREKNIDQDPRPYVAGLRAFASKHNVALADASLRYGRLWRQGIPYSSLMSNSINHPDERGMKIFADALMAIFP
jgi:lysophospholipase L1-like esterase